METFQQPVLLFFKRLYHDPTFRMVSQTGGDSDAVVGGGLEVAPVGVGNNLYRLDRIGTGTVDGSVGDGIAPLQVLMEPMTYLLPRLWPHTETFPSQAEVEL